MRNKIAGIVAATRSQEWWGYKLPPLLALGYATALQAGVPLLNIAFWLLQMLGTIIIGAIYVSVINDITDLKEDLASGKQNRMANVPPIFRLLIPIVCVLVGCIYLYFGVPDRLSALLYALPWVSFSLYSFPPIRLKNRGIWGVLADACGSHVFISLFMVSGISYVSAHKIDWVWFIAVGVWALMFGLRGILWHQFTDRENDLQANVNTFASTINPQFFQKPAWLLMAIELVAFMVMLQRIALLLPLLLLPVYLVIVLIRLKKRKQKIVIVLAPKSQAFQIFMLDYYQVFLPVSLLFSAAFLHASDTVLIVLHLLLFSHKAQAALKDLMWFTKGTARKVFPFLKPRAN